MKVTFDAMSYRTRTIIGILRERVHKIRNISISGHKITTFSECGNEVFQILL